MTVNLPDINVLIALAWPNHIHHTSARAWFSRHRQEPFATCPLTEAGFVRLSMNPSVVVEAVPFHRALQALGVYRNLPNHIHWNDDIDFISSVEQFSLTGYRQITDAYLLGLALHNNGRLVTFDKKIQTLAAGNPSLESHILLIRADQ